MFLTTHLYNSLGCDMKRIGYTKGLLPMRFIPPRYYVYALFRPDNGQIFYVGMGTGARADQHERDRRETKSHKDRNNCKRIEEFGYHEVLIEFYKYYTYI